MGAGAPEAGSADARRERLRNLQAKMQDSARANRREVAAEQTKQRESTQKRPSASSARALARAERILDERDMMERGEDVDRHRALHYTIEENDAWERRLEEKERRRDKGATDFQELAERSYQRQIAQLKPDHAAYAAQKRAEAERAESERAGSSKDAAPAAAPSQALTTRKDDEKAVARPSVPLSVAEYGQHRPDEAAVDRLVSHLNNEYVRRSDGHTNPSDRSTFAGAAAVVRTTPTTRSPTSTRRTSTLTRKSNAYVRAPCLCMLTASTTTSTRKRSARTVRTHRTQLS